MNMEEMEKKIKELEKRIVQLEQNKDPTETQNLRNVSNIVNKIAEKIDDIPTSHIVILSLYIQAKQSTLDIQQVIKGWGWSPDTFFEKGHFSSDILKKGFVHDISGKDDKKGVFSLTSKGELLAKNLIEKYSLS